MAVLPSESSWRLWARRGLWVLAVVLVCWFTGPRFVASLRPPRTTILDFFQEWASARNHFVGLPIYADQRIAMERHLQSRLPKDAPFALDINAHPPTSVLLVLPFALLDYPDAFLAWNLFSLAALVFSLWLIARELNLRFSVWAIPPLLALLLMCGPLQQQTNQGQLNLVLLALITGTWVADRRGWPIVAGSLLGAAAAIKLFPAFLFLYFLVRGKWKVLGSGLVSGLLLTALTAGILGPAAFQDYIHDALPRVSLFRDWWANASLTGFWCKLFNAPSHHVVELWSNPWLARGGILISCLLLTAMLVRLIRKARSTAETDLAFGLSIVVMLLVSPITWDHYFLLLLPTLAILWTRMGSPSLAGWILSGICILTLIALTANHYILLGLLTLPIAVWLWQSPRSGSARVLALLCIGLCISPKVIWDATIPGADEIHGGVAQPMQTLILLSYQCYTLLALFFFGLTRSHYAASLDGVVNAEERTQPNGQSATSTENAESQPPFVESASLQLHGM
jgi:hypothetical protein